MSSIKRNLFLSALTSLLKFYSGFFIFVILSRYFSIADFGILNFGFSLGLIVGTCAEFGYSLMATRDIPQRLFELNSYVYNTLVQKLIISLLVIGIFFIYLGIAFTDKDYLIGVIFIGYAIVNSFNLYYLGIFRARKKFNYELFTSLSNAIIISVVIVLTIQYQWSVIRFIILLLASKAFQLLIAAITFHFKFYQKNSFKLDLNIQRYLLKNSWSFGLTVIIGTLYFQVDTQMLNYFCGSEIVGLYQAPFKIIMFLLISYDIIFQVYTPYIAEQYKKLSRESLSNLISTLLKYIITTSIVAFGTIVIFFKPLITLVFGVNYLEAAPILPILGAVVVIRMIASVYGILLIVGNYQNYRAKAVFITLVFTLTMNYFLIPLFGIFGAAIVSLATHLVLILIYLFFIRKHFYSSLINLRSKLKLALSGLVLILFLTYGYNSLLIVITIIALIFAVTDIKKKELMSLLKF